MLTWHERQARHIEKHLREKHGSGWRYLSPHQRNAYRSEQVLLLLLAQGTETLSQFKPSHELVRGVLSHLTTEEVY